MRVINGARVAAAFVGVLAVASCGSDGTPETRWVDTLVIERRPMTDAEYDRIDDDGGGGVLECPKPGEQIWDYGPIGTGEVRNRQPDDALVDAITEINEQLVAEDAAAFVPRTGWIELTRDGSSPTFVHTRANWRFLVHVDGDPELGVWRHSSALVCPPST